MDAHIITTIVTALGILGGFYAILTRTENQLNRRLDERFAAAQQHTDDLHKSTQMHINNLETSIRGWDKDLHRWRNDIEGLDTRIGGRIEEGFGAINKRFDENFGAINKRFDDMRDLWRAELRRVEEVIGERLKPKP